jgi:hypothetical protein
MIAGATTTVVPMGATAACIIEVSAGILFTAFLQLELDEYRTANLCAIWPSRKVDQSSLGMAPVALAAESTESAEYR